MWLNNEIPRKRELLALSIFPVTLYSKAFVV